MNDARHNFTSRTTPCTFCDSGKATMIESFGYYSVPCPECSGAGEIDASCADCLCVKPINADGFCERCSDASELPLAVFRARYELDPANKHRWVA